jgi:hypothetical protein
MPGVQYFLLKKFARLWIELEAGFSEPLQHFPQDKQVLLDHVTNHNHVQVQETRFWTVAEAKGHD